MFPTPAAQGRRLQEAYDILGEEFDLAGSLITPGRWRVADDGTQI